MTVQAATRDLWLSPVEDHDEAVARLLATTPRVGFPGVCADLNRDARPARIPSSLPADGLAWDISDNTSARWWPGDLAWYHRHLLVSWGSRVFQGQDHGCRLTVLDLASERFRHVLVTTVGDSFGELVLRPLQVDAHGLVVTPDGTVVLSGGRRGVFLGRLEEIVAVEPSAETFGYRYVLPVRTQLRGETVGPGDRLRCDLLALDGDALVIAENGAGGAARVARFPLSPTTTHVRATSVERHGVPDLTGLAMLDGVRYVAREHGRRPGELVVDGPAATDRHRRRQLTRALPAGPGGLTAHEGRLWGLSRPPGHRFVFSLQV